MDDLVYQRELWEKRAAVARECGEELGELARACRSVVRRNYFGSGCVEGAVVFEGLQGLLGAAVAALDGHRAGLEDIESAAEAARREFEDTDLLGANYVGP